MCQASRADVPSRRAQERAEELLTSYLLPCQAEDWKQNRAFNLRGSEGRLWRLADRSALGHDSVIRQGRMGVSVWPIGLGVAADRILGLMLYLQDDEDYVYMTGCHAMRVRGPREVNGDYGGMI
jgi:hypothetical protein